MKTIYKVRACCGSSLCEHVEHEDVTPLVDRKTSIAFALKMNEESEFGKRKKCPRCRQPMYYYSIQYETEPDR